MFVAAQTTGRARSVEQRKASPAPGCLQLGKFNYTTRVPTDVAEHWGELSLGWERGSEGLAPMWGNHLIFRSVTQLFEGLIDIIVLCTPKHKTMFGRSQLALNTLRTKVAIYVAQRGECVGSGSARAKIIQQRPASPCRDIEQQASESATNMGFRSCKSASMTDMSCKEMLSLARCI